MLLGVGVGTQTSYTAEILKVRRTNNGVFTGDMLFFCSVMTNNGVALRACGIRP